MAVEDASMKAESPRTGVKGAVVVGAFFAVAFIAVPLTVVALRGGGNLHSCVYRWDLLRARIQSEEKGDLAMGDASKDRALIERFLVPSADRAARAQTYYNAWRDHAGWSHAAALGGIAYGEDGQSAEVTQEVTMKREGQKKKHTVVSAWVKREGVWYLKSNDEAVRPASAKGVTGR